MRTWPGSPSASPAATRCPRPQPRRQLGARRSPGRTPTRSWPGCRRPRSRGCAARRSARTRRSQTARTRRSDQLRAVRSASRAPAWESSETPRSGSSSASSSSAPGPADRVADAQAREPPGLGEAAEDQQLGVLLEQRQRGVDRLGVGEVHERLVEQHAPPPGAAPPADAAARPVASSSPVGSLGLASAITRTSPLVGRPPAAPQRPPATRSGRPWARLAMSGNSG